MFKYLWPLLFVCFSTSAMDGIFRLTYSRETVIDVTDQNGKKTKEKKTYTGWGSAFRVDLPDLFPNEKNVFLTVGHNLFDEEKKVVIDKVFIDWKDEGDEIKAKVDVLYFNKKFDLAIIKTKRDAPGQAIKMSSDLPKIGQDLILIGCPKGVEPMISKGKFVTYFSNDDPSLVMKALAEVKVDYFFQGSSGCPVLSTDKSMFYGIVVGGPALSNGDIDSTRALIILNPIINIFLEEARQVNRK